MRPTREQIELAAYQRWQRREWGHGSDCEDWIAVEQDLAFALNYRYVARYKLSGSSPVMLGKSEAESSTRRRRCRFCEQAEPSATFRDMHLTLPAIVGNTSLHSWDECDDCHAQYDRHLAGPFESFVGPLLNESPDFPVDGISVAALKAFVRMALAVLPASELQHFGDTIEWVANPDHVLDSTLLDGEGCLVYRTPSPVPSASFALARRVEDDEGLPYMIAFLALASSRVVLQTQLPLCPRDEELEDSRVPGPKLSMSLGYGAGHRASDCTFLQVTLPKTVRVTNRTGRYERADSPTAAGGGSRPHQ